MTLSLKDRVKELTTTTGTGTLTLVSAPTGYRRFSAVFSNGDTTYYCIESGSQWEVGVGTYNSNTLARTTVLASSNSNSLIDIVAARSFVFVTYAADKAVYKDGSNRTLIGSAGLIFSDASVQTTAATSPDLSPYLTISSAASTYLTQSSATTLLAAKADLVGGLIPSAQLPSYVDDVVEAANLAAFPGTGETGKIYVAIDTGYTYRWSGSVYVRINEVDLSSYLTAATAASTYLPLAGGTLVGDLKFTDATYDIGKSGATRPRDGFFSRNLTVGTSIALPGYGSSGSPVLSWGGGDFGLYASTFGVAFRAYGSAAAVAALNSGLCVTSGSTICWSSTSSVDGTRDLCLWRGGANVLDLQNSTNAQTFRLAETWTSSTSFGALQIKANAGAAYQIGSAIGSAGGSNRAIELGHYDSAGTFTSALSVATAGNITVLANKWIKASDTTERLYFSSSATYVKGSQLIVRNASDAETFTVSANGEITHVPVVRTSGSPTALTLTDAAHTTMTASTEATSVNFNLSSTKQFATGALTTQRAFRIQAPTYSFVGASTITTASTLSISGPPAAGTNATITNAYALNVESGKIYITNPENSTSALTIGGTTSGISLLGNSSSRITFGTSGAGHIEGSTNSLCFGISGANRAYFDTGFLIENGYGSGYRWTSGGIYGTAWGFFSSTAHKVEQRSGTNAQTFEIYNSYTSSSSNDLIRIRANAGAAYQIGSAKGSAGGNNQAIDFGHWDAAGAFSSQWSLLTTNVLYSSTSGSSTVLQTAGGVYINGNWASTPHLSVNGWWGLTGTASGGISLASGHKIAWGSTASNAPFSGTSGDIGLARNAAGVLEVNTGTIGTLAALTCSTLTTSGAIYVPTDTLIGTLSGTTGIVASGTSYVSVVRGGTAYHSFHVGSTHQGSVLIRGDVAAAAFGWGSSIGANLVNTLTTGVYQDSAGVMHQRNSTNAQTFRVAGTWTSTTSYETLNLKGKASANFEIGPENGSAGGTLRGLTLGCYPAGTATIVGWAQFRPNASTGALEAFYLGPIADSTATGGNARGTNAVDLQSTRSTAAQVVSGNNSLGSGTRNTISGTNCGGIGVDNVVSGNNSFTAGNTNSVGHDNSSAFGVFAATRMSGMRVVAQDSYDSQGAAQLIEATNKNKTTSATPVNWDLPLTSGNTYHFNLLVAGVKSDGAAIACYTRRISAINIAGTVTILNSQTIGTDYEDNASTDLTVSASGSNVRVSVTGIAAETWRWQFALHGVEIKYGT